ncbi:MAG TPA: hypothetical protein VLS90_20335, partial [Thermodesulfobacteriota bacterium]|nr:hypothetical protein [Thermodesulfobacteriota bacterium]
MGKANQFSSVFWFVVGLAIAFGSYRMGLGSMSHPGPGFLAFACGSILAGLSVLVFVKGTLSPEKGPGLVNRLWGGK